MYVRITTIGDICIREANLETYIDSLSESVYETHIRSLYYVSNFIDALNAENYD